MYPADVMPFQKLAGKMGQVILPGLGCSSCVWTGFPSSKSFSPAGFVICCCSPCRKELTVAVLWSPPAQGFHLGWSQQIEPGKAFRKDSLDRLYWREAPSHPCAEWAAAGQMQICNPSCWLAQRLLTASSSLLERAFLHAALSPVVTLPKLSWQAEVWLLMQCIAGTSLAVAQNRHFSATDNLRCLFTSTVVFQGFMLWRKSWKKTDQHSVKLLLSYLISQMGIN